MVSGQPVKDAATEAFDGHRIDPHWHALLATAFTDRDFKAGGISEGHVASPSMLGLRAAVARRPPFQETMLCFATMQSACTVTVARTAAGSAVAAAIAVYATGHHDIVIHFSLLFRFNAVTMIGADPVSHDGPELSLYPVYTRPTLRLSDSS
jgi:hypothetical protein